MYQIEISNSQDCLEIDEEFLRKAAERVLAEEEVAAAEISVALVDNATIHALNRQYLNHDYATDVLSFLLDSEPGDSSTTKSATLRGKGMRLDGELIVSTETAKQVAQDFGWSPREEVVLYVIHGLLHLVGYDDLSSTEQAVMRARERAILAKLEISLPEDSARGESDRSPADASDDEPERPASDPSKRRTES